jgi:hypothetical protein
VGVMVLVVFVVGVVRGVGCIGVFGGRELRGGVE